MTSFARARWWLPLGLFVLSVTWGYAWVLAKQALAFAPPLAFAAERMTNPSADPLCFSCGVGVEIQRKCPACDCDVSYRSTDKTAVCHGCQRMFEVDGELPYMLGSLS